MGSQWTDESAIMRDLSFAQGRFVPGGIDTAVASGKPPTHNITEETEEEYFKRWTTDGDFSAGPDLSLITQMLEMVDDEVPDTEEIPTGAIEIKKLNAGASVFVPKFKKTEKRVPEKTELKHTQEKVEPKLIRESIQVKPLKENTEKKKKPLRQRNIAIASIIANSMKTSQVEDIPIKLAKPEDFIKTSSVSKPIDREEINALNRRKDSVNKVNSWLQTQEITSMFKKKTSLSSVNEDSNKIKTDSIKSPVESDTSVKSPQTVGQQYVPSSWAGEYYKQCVVRAHMRDMVQEDVWARAEKIMKEIDVRKEEELRKQEEADAALAALAAAAEEALKLETEDDDNDKENDTPVGDSQESGGIASVLLPQHRHLLPDDCIVCKVLSKPEKKALLETKNKEQQVSEDSEIELDVIEKAGDQELFCLVRSSIVENLADLEAVELKGITRESDSSELLDMSTTES